MAFSQYFATQILSWVKSSAFPSAPTNVYVTPLISIGTGSLKVSGSKRLKPQRSQTPGDLTRSKNVNVNVKAAANAKQAARHMMKASAKR